MPDINDAVQVVVTVTAIRTFIPKIDGWLVVLVAALVSAALAFTHHGATVESAEDAVRILVWALGGWETIKRLLQARRAPELAKLEELSAPVALPPKEQVQ